MLIASVAGAQTDTLAESLFRDARAAMKAGDPERACPLFAESYRLDPAHGTLFNLGVCEQQRGKLASAWAAFRKLVDVAPAEDERVAEATARLGAMERDIPRLRLSLSQPLPPDHALELDGVTLGPGALSGLLRVDPGRHELRVVHAGEARRVLALDVAVGQTLSYELEPVTAPPRAAPSAPVRPEPPGREERRPPPRPASAPYAAYTALGFGGAGVTASLVLGVLALRARDVTDAHCREKLCDPDGMAAAERGAKLASLSTASAIAGLAGLAAGGLLLWRADDDTTEVRVTGSGATVEGTF